MFIQPAHAENPWYFNDGINTRHGPYATEPECFAEVSKPSNIGFSATGCYQQAPIPAAPVTPPAAYENATPVDVNPQTQVDLSGDGTYTLLAPIGGITEIKTTGGTCPGNPGISNGIGCYLNIIFILGIGLCGVLAVIMIVIGGIQYMGDESVFGKTEAKSKILSAVLGLFIALGAYVLLKTINPALTGQNGVMVDSVGVEIIDAPDAGDDTVDPGFAKKDYRYSTDAIVSPGVTNVVTKIKQGWQISYFKVYSNERMQIGLRKGTEVDTNNIIDVRSGLNGFSEVGQGKSKDKKTPKGTWKILQIRTSKDGKPVFNKTGSNMGATFWLLSPTTNGDRGIGMHGNKNGTLSRTVGCVRLKNSDLLALLPYVKTGISVIIGD